MSLSVSSPLAASDAAFADILPLLDHLPPNVADNAAAFDALCDKAGFDPGAVRPLLAHLQSWQKRVPVLAHPRICAFASHYATGAAQTEQTIHALNGDAHPLKRLAALLNADLRVYELDLAQSAPDARQAAQAMTYGMLAIEEKGDVVIVASLSEGADAAAARIDLSDAATPDAVLHALVPQIGLDLFAGLGACLAARLAEQPVLTTGRFGTLLRDVLARLAPEAASHVLVCDALPDHAVLPTIYTPIQWLQRAQFALAFLPAPQKTVHLSARVAS